MTPPESSNFPDTSGLVPAPDLIPPDKIETRNEPADTIRIPVIEEQLQVSKRLVETDRVRLIKTVHQHEQIVSIPLMVEEILVERVAMDQLVDVLPSTRQEGNVTIYPVLQEEYVLQKRLRLVEEIRVTKQQVHTTHSQAVVLRQEKVRVERDTDDSSGKHATSSGESI